MASNYPPAPPPGGPPQPPYGGPPMPPYGGVPPVAPPPYQPPIKKKTSPWLWVLFGCLGLILIIGIGIAAVAGWGYYRLKNHPGETMAKLILAGNPDAELVSVDEARGILRVRDKKTGKVVTMNFDDVKKGKFSFEGEGGEKFSVEGQGDNAQIKVQTGEGTATINAGGAVKLPDWFPSYPGVTPQSNFSLSDASSNSAGFQFATTDSAARVLEFYESGLKNSGLKVSTMRQGEGGIITAQDDDQQREAMVTVTTSGSGANVNATFKSKR